MPDRNGKMPKNGIYEYLSWRGDIGFDILPPGEVDSMIFSIISYIDFDEIIAEEITQGKTPVLLSATRAYLRSKHGTIKDLGLIIPREIVTLLVRASKTPRFGLCRPFFYTNRICDTEQKQFSAMSFALSGGSTFIAFRGTDDTLVGWKENFNMSFMHPVPAQTEALMYLEEVARKTTGKIYMGGHSKGGNLAVFAAVKASNDVKERIAAVYNHDGPGFDADFIRTEEYAQMREKLHTLVPQTSIIGMLLEHEESYKVVKSSSAGLLQHNGMSWEVMGGSFVKLDSVDEESKSIDRSLKAWLAELNAEERESFVDSLFEALASTNVRTLTEFREDKGKLLRAWGSMDGETRSNLLRCINLIFSSRKTQKQIKITENETENAENEENQEQEQEE